MGKNTGESSALQSGVSGLRALSVGAGWAVEVREAAFDAERLPATLGFSFSCNLWTYLNGMSCKEETCRGCTSGTEGT